MNQTIKLDTRKREGKYGEARIAPLRRGERNNALLTVKVCANGQPYDLSGKTASLVATTAAGKLVGPCPMEAAEAGIARIMLPAALYSAVGAFSGYVEIRDGDTLVDTTDSFGGMVIECADLDTEQAEEFTPLLGELQNAVAEEAKRVEAEKARVQAETERETGFAEAKQASQAATEAANDAAAGARNAAGSASSAAESATTAARKATDAAAKAESDVRAFVNAASTAVGDAIAGAREDVDAAVKRSDAATAKAEDATKTADAANTAATQAVSDARDAIAEVKATEAKLYPAAENILVGSDSGAVAHVEDAFEGATLRKITVEGACKQDGTPGPDAPKPITVIEHPTVKVAGKNLLSPSKMAATWINYVDADGELQVKYGDGRGWAAIPEYGILPAGVYYICGDAIEVRRASDNVTLAYTQGNVAGFKLDTATSVMIKVGFARPDSQYPYVSHAMLLAANGKDVAYAPYTSASLTFTLPAEHPYLAKLPDGTADEIVVDEEGNVELVARVTKTVLDGSQLFYDVNIDGIETYFELSEPIGSGKLPDVQWGGLYDRFVTSNPYTAHQGACAYCFSVSNGIIFRIRPSETFASSEGFNNWLKSNPVTSYHAGTEPKTYPLGKIEMPKAQDSIVNVWTDAEVTPRTCIEYVRDVNIVVANIEKAIASITQG